VYDRSGGHEWTKLEQDLLAKLVRTSPYWFLLHAHSSHKCPVYSRHMNHYISLADRFSLLSFSKVNPTA
jgi:hypothetical protein